VNNKIVFAFIVLFALFQSRLVFAEFSPATIKAGGVDIVPVVEFSEFYDSNILYSESATKNDLITRITPGVSASLASGANEYLLTAGALLERFSKSKVDNFIDTDIAVDLHQSITRKFILDVKAKRINAHEERGLNYSRGLNTLAKPDAYALNEAVVKLRYGGRESIGRMVFSIGNDSRVFNSRREITRFRDLENKRAGMTFYYHLMPKTSLLFELSQRKIDYRNNKADNSTEQRFFIGSRWDISALTSGTAKAGLLSKKFDDMAKSSVSTFSWEIGARWSPLTYSVVDIVTKGLFEESDDINNYYIDSQSLLLKWVHFWAKNVDTTIHANALNRVYKQSGRNDKLKKIGIDINYHFRRWMDVGVGYNFADSQSNISGYSYNKNVFFLSVKLGL